MENYNSSSTMKEILVRGYTQKKGRSVREHVRHIGGYSGLSIKGAAAVAASIFDKKTPILGQSNQGAFNASTSHLAAEVLAKAAYSDNNFQLPSGYKTKEKFSDPNTGLAVTVFQSPKSTVIAFRGTDLKGGDFKDVLEDIDTDGVGYGRFENSYGLLAGIAQKYPKATITGHSLGGALAQRYAAEFGGGEVITFNSPGIDKHTAAKFKKGNTKVTHYVSEGDPVSLGGERFIDGDAKIVSYKSRKIPIIGNTLDKHMAVITSGLIGMEGAKVKTIHAKELSKDNFKYGGLRATGFTDRGTVENLRKLVGVAAYPLNITNRIAGKALTMIGNK